MLDASGSSVPDDSLGKLSQSKIKENTPYKRQESKNSIGNGWKRRNLCK